MKRSVLVAAALLALVNGVAYVVAALFALIACVAYAAQSMDVYTSSGSSQVSYAKGVWHYQQLTPPAFSGPARWVEVASFARSVQRCDPLPGFNIGNHSNWSCSNEPVPGLVVQLCGGTAANPAALGCADVSAIGNGWLHTWDSVVYSSAAGQPRMSLRYMLPTGGAVVGFRPGPSHVALHWNAF